MKNVLLLLLMSSLYTPTFAQPDRWQQKVKYVMDIDVNVETNRFNGKQKLEYWNNSPDTLFHVFYHLYWNAFQPNSLMDMRSRELGKIEYGNGNKDWDARVRDRIYELRDDEMGYQKIQSLKMDGITQKFEVHETILKVVLTKPIAPKSKVVFDMEFESQVPLQIRRAGRDNPQTEVRYSMSQWYPKLCAYDYAGWHPTPYVAREFYGNWGDFEVNISIDKNYILGGTGYLQNAQQIGYGYEAKGTKVTRPNTPKLTWKFTAPNVHDFVWAADPGFKHITRQVPNGPTIHVLYKNKPNNEANDKAWAEVGDATVAVFPFVEGKFGKYPYKQYSYIQGGDGGMEYPMATLVAGPGLGTAFHELMHSWYQMMLGFNESLYGWMDEGFTVYGSTLMQQQYQQIKAGAVVKGNAASTGPANTSVAGSPNLHSGSYNNYFALVKSGAEEPLTTHADHFNSNFAYSIASYSKGAVYLAQLGYIIGEAQLEKTLLQFYNRWKFKHPNDIDFVRVAEDVSGVQLDWYNQYFVHTTKTIDYAIDSLWEKNGKIQIRLKKHGDMPMPIDVLLEFKDGSKQWAYIPQLLMFGSKPAEDELPRTIFEAWRWTHPLYTFEIDKRLIDIKTIEIDPSQRMADVNRANNKLTLNW